MSDAYDFDDDDPSPEAQEARARAREEMLEDARLRAEAEKRRLRRRPLLQLLCAGIILGIWLFMRWGFGAPETAAANVAHLVFFALGSMIAAFFISNATMAPTNGTSGALGLFVMWCIGMAVIGGAGILGGLLAQPYGCVAGLNSVFSLIIGLASLFLTVAL